MKTIEPFENVRRLLHDLDTQKYPHMLLNEL